jgi:hypothetical protein
MRRADLEVMYTNLIIVYGINSHGERDMWDRDRDKDKLYIGVVIWICPYVY